MAKVSAFIALFLTLSSVNGLVIPKESLISVESFPYIVSIQKMGSHFCSGVLINSKYVLTSASCLDFIDPFEIPFMRVIAGATRPDKEGIPRKIVGFSIHPQHSNIHVTFDAGLIELIGDYAFTDKISPASLIEETVTIPIGTAVNMTGYGLNQADAAPRILRYAEIEILERDQCQELFSKNTKDINDQLICAGDASGNVASGDAGAPLTLDGKLIGYTSVLSQTDYLPSLFTNISAVRPWIKEITGV